MAALSCVWLRPRTPKRVEQLEGLVKLYEQTRTQASAILGNLQGLVSAREAQSAIVAETANHCVASWKPSRPSCPPKLGVGAGQLAALVLARPSC